MTRVLVFLKNWLPVLLVASLAMYFLTGRVLTTDEAVPVVHSFVRSNERILSEVGSIQEVKIVKRVSVSAMSTAAAHSLYTVDVRGSTASITAVVRRESGSDGGVATLESVIR